MNKNYSELFNNLENMVATQKFETVLETAYDVIVKESKSAYERNLMLKDTLEEIMKNKSPYFHKKMVTKCFSKPYSKWLEALIDVTVEIEAEKIRKRRKNRFSNCRYRDEAKKTVNEMFREVMENVAIEELFNCIFDLLVSYENELLLGNHIDRICTHLFERVFDFSEKFKEDLYISLFQEMFKCDKFRLAMHFGAINIWYIHEALTEEAMSELEKLVLDENYTKFTDADKKVCLAEIEYYKDKINELSLFF